MGDKSEASADAGNLRRVQVWDLPVRIFHWTLVVLLLFSWWSGKVGGNYMQYHLWSGYAILTLGLFRLGWGFCRSGNARFADFVSGPRAVIAYLRTLTQRRSGGHLGHNPLGGWSVVLMLLCILVQTGSGLFANDDIATEGPLAVLVSKATSDFLTTIHAYNFYVLLVLGAMHIVAVIFYLFYKAENLIWPMISGYKMRPANEPERSVPRTANGWAGALLAVAAGIVYLIVR